MSSKTMSVVVIISVLASARFSGASADNNVDPAGDSKLRIHLPREATIEGDSFSLGQVGIVRGQEPFVTKANEVSLGRISTPGQKVVVDRATVLTRLACSGIPSSSVVLSGAERLTVTQRQQIIKGNQLVDLAKSFLKKSLRGGYVYQLDPTRIPAEIVVPGGSEDIELSPRLVEGDEKNRPTVQIAMLSGGKQIETRDITFPLKYGCHRAVALVDIAAGAAVSADNVKVEETLSDRPEPAGWRPPYGLVAKRPIAAGTVICPNMTARSKPQIVLKRNETVVIRIDMPGFLVTAVGKAVQDGCAGDYIKVRNIDSKRIILARVNEDGTVEPVL
ncbi:MAG TPA: flagellar basal body P-ring formation chaperone FlgA [Sedimentisphaerales bacterium]|nr:flagellar basal body P-ring formation chaperone FlgA [Sedimentisphaerales bacterium]